MKNLEVREMTQAGIFSGIILFLSLVPAPWGLTWGFIPGIGGIEFTIIHIAVIVGAIFSTKRVAIFLGFVFGLGSLIAAAIYAPPLGIVFLNPLVSILPRMFFGYFVYLFYELFSKLFKQKSLAMLLTFSLSTFAHTIMVLTMIYLMSLFAYYNESFTSIFGNIGIIKFFSLVISFNAVIEILLAVLVGTPVGLRIKEFRDATTNK